MNIFEGTNAKDGAAKIKAKLGVDSVKVCNIEIHEDRMEVTVQDPAKPKNFDAYTYSKGVLSGPRPVEALVLGNHEFPADKSRLFSLDETNLGAVPEVCRKAMDRAQVEDGKPELISIDWQSASLTKTKAERGKIKADESAEFERNMRAGKRSDPMASIRRGFSDLVVTWRVWVKGPRATKDFWFDKNGKLSEEPY
ncbi:MAG: hypothetical protein ABI967_01685 [bacterium]